MSIEWAFKEKEQEEEEAAKKGGRLEIFSTITIAIQSESWIRYDWVRCTHSDDAVYWEQERF